MVRSEQPGAAIRSYPYVQDPLVPGSIAVWTPRYHCHFRSNKDDSACCGRLERSAALICAQLMSGGIEIMSL